MEESQNDVEKEAEIANNHSKIKFIPRLKKNRRLELRWGQQYYIALQDAVFSVKNNFYSSSEIPMSLKDNSCIREKNHICEACGDSFYFQSSLDDHVERYSWILGYWCHHCFQIRCDHTIDGKLLCHTCYNVSKIKRAYLRTKGLRKGQKVGAIFLFYNQCQFFEHLKKHNVTVIDMNDIMLMPLPHNVQQDEYSQMEHICKALMEYMFINRIHIMDWLRNNKLDCKWWKDNCSNDNSLGQLIEKYNDNCNNVKLMSSRQFRTNKNSSASNVAERLSESSEDDTLCDNNLLISDNSLAQDDAMNSNSKIKELFKNKLISKKPSASLASMSEINDLGIENKIEISTATSQHPSNSVHNKKIIVISQESGASRRESSTGDNNVENTEFGENTKRNVMITSQQISVSSDCYENEEKIVNKKITCMKVLDGKIICSPGANIVVKKDRKLATSVLKVNSGNNSLSLVTPKFSIVKNKLKISSAKVAASEIKYNEEMKDHQSPIFADASNNLSDNPQIPLTDNNTVPVDEIIKDSSIVPRDRISSKKDEINSVEINTEQENSKLSSDKTELHSPREKESINSNFHGIMGTNLQQSDKKIIQKVIGSANDTNKNYRIPKKNQKHLSDSSNNKVKTNIDRNELVSHMNKQIPPLSFGSCKVESTSNRTVTPEVVSINTVCNQLENETSASRVLMLSPLNLENGEVKLHKENEEMADVSKPYIIEKLNSSTHGQDCNGVKENNANNSDTNPTQINDIKGPLITELETQSEIVYIKEEKLDVRDLPPVEKQQESSIMKKNDTSLCSATSTIHPMEIKIEETGINELSDDNNKSEIQNRFLECKSSCANATMVNFNNEIKSNMKLSIKDRKLGERPWRIALNGPNNSDIPPINYKCHLCGELISSSWSIANSHFRTKHSKDYKVTVIAPMLTRLSSNIIEIELKDNSKKRKLDSTMVTVKKRRRWAHKKFPDRSTSPSLGICIRQESLQDTEGNFKCKKCECLFKDVCTLREHVASNHRIRGHFLICLECGENFVVAPSLQMHLKAFHGITDPITYMAQNTAYAPDMTDELEAQERITESNQCHVCMAVFEDKSALDKHFRVHGMAFLNRKRIEARNALKSPEKKIEITSSTLNANKVGQEMEKKNINANTNNQDGLPESDSANVNILTRISRLLS